MQQPKVVAHLHAGMCGCLIQGSSLVSACRDVWMPDTRIVPSFTHRIRPVRFAVVRTLASVRIGSAMSRTPHLCRRMAVAKAGTRNIVLLGAIARTADPVGIEDAAIDRNRSFHHRHALQRSAINKASPKA